MARLRPRKTSNAVSYILGRLVIRWYRSRVGGDRPKSVHIRTPQRARTRARSINNGGQAPVGEIGLTMACSAHRAVRRISLIFSQELMMAETLQTEIRLRRTRARAQAGRFTRGLGYGFTGCKVGSLGHGLLHLREGWVDDQKQADSISVPAPRTVLRWRGAPGRRVW